MKTQEAYGNLQVKLTLLDPSFLSADATAPGSVFGSFERRSVCAAGCELFGFRLALDDDERNIIGCLGTLRKLR